MESSLPTWDRGVPGLLEEVGRGVSVCRQWASRHCQVLLVPLNLDTRAMLALKTTHRACFYKDNAA